MDLLLRPWRHYADFSGRSRRWEYFLFFIAFYLAIFLLAVIGTIVSMSTAEVKEGEPGTIGIILAALLFVAGFVPALAVSVRRMHDQDETGWLVLVNFVPYIGGLIFFVLTLLPGTEGENDYGPNPRHDAPDRTAEIFS
jgi:uncharacterized membrane protein YhaH (DUF805 family)